MSPPLLDVSGLVSGYGAVVAVHGIDLAAETGQVTAIVGSNGAGKSTTLRAIAGLLPARGGEIRFDGGDVTGLSADHRVDQGIVLVPEGRLIFAQMSVEENLRIGAFTPRARPLRSETMATVYDLFPRLAERRSQPGGTLSGGEQQMLALGRGMMACPRILLLDEPTLGLAPLMAETIFEAVRRLVDDGLTLVIAEQDVSRTLSLADTACVIENGRVVKTGAGADLLGDPDVKKAYLGL